MWEIQSRASVKPWKEQKEMVLDLNSRGYIRNISSLVIGINSDWSGFRFFTSFAMLSFPGSFSQVFASLRVVCHSLHTLYFDKVEIWAHSFWSYTIVILLHSSRAPNSAHIYLGLWSRTYFYVLGVDHTFSELGKVYFPSMLLQ